jgi:hypothetical protein
MRDLPILITSAAFDAPTCAARYQVHRETSELKLIAMGGRFGFAWVTGMFFVISLVEHWLFGWFAYVNEQRVLQQPFEVGAYVVQMTRELSG